MTTLIRPAKPADAKQCLDIYEPIVLETPISFETEAPTVEEFERRIRDTMESYPWLVGVADGRVAGYAYACKHRQRRAYQWSVEVSAYVDEAFRRKGVGRSLYERLFEYLKRQGFCNAYAGIALPNPASVAFHESMGFEPVGIYKSVGFKLGRWHDVGWWALRLADADCAPAAPIPFTVLRDQTY